MSGCLFYSQADASKLLKGYNNLKMKGVRWIFFHETVGYCLVHARLVVHHVLRNIIWPPLDPQEKPRITLWGIIMCHATVCQGLCEKLCLLMHQHCRRCKFRVGWSEDDVHHICPSSKTDTKKSFIFFCSAATSLYNSSHMAQLNQCQFFNFFENIYHINSNALSVYLCTMKSNTQTKEPSVTMSREVAESRFLFCEQRRQFSCAKGSLKWDLLSLEDTKTPEDYIKRMFCVAIPTVYYSSVYSMLNFAICLQSVSGHANKIAVFSFFQCQTAMLGVTGLACEDPKATKAATNPESILTE